MMILPQPTQNPARPNYLINTYNQCLPRVAFVYLIRLTYQPASGDYLDSTHFTAEKVLEALRNLDPKKASGIDNIPQLF